jgi:hypothetical protein
MSGLALFVTHNIFFNKQQISNLLKKNCVKLIGVSVPVWVNAKNSKTTEPAQEFFCKYEIYKEQRENDVVITKNGYVIHLAKSDWKNPAKISYKNLSNMEEEERLLFLEKRDKWWKKNQKPHDIFDFEKTNYFRMEVKKIDYKFEKLHGLTVDCQHVVQIKTIEKLLSSLVT